MRLPCQAPSNATVTLSNAQYNGTVNGANNHQMSSTTQNPNQGSYYDARRRNAAGTGD